MIIFFFESFIFQKKVDGTIYKTYRLFAKDGDFIDIELERHDPKSTMIAPLDKSHKVIAKETFPDGTIQKLGMNFFSIVF